LVEETTYLAAMCAVYNSPKASLDQTETEVALDELQNFITRFPNSERVDTCNIVMNSLRFKLQTKEVMNVRLYSKTGNYRAAVVSAKSYLETYPVTQYREEVYAILLRNQKLLAENSIDTKLEERIVDAEDTYANFLAEFPESLYLREFDNYLMQVRELRVKKTTE
jgi:outer membrane protein assembly factor BamD